MFELPEYITLAEQINSALSGQRIRSGYLGNSPHKFVWYNRTHQEFSELIRGRTVGTAHARGKWLFVALEPGYVLLLGECGGKLLYHPPESPVPNKYHLYIVFEDDSFLTAMTRMWGAMELYERGAEQERQYIRGMRPTPIEPEFTLDYFSGLVDELIVEKKQSAKGLLTQDQTIPGLGNAIAQDILFRARLHPRHALHDLGRDERLDLYRAILETVREIIDKGGRYDEYDLYNNPGGYVRIMDRNSMERPCPECGGAIEKIQYLGGACYFCPSCQR